MIDNTLQERGERYGSFSGHAELSQAIKRIMRRSLRWADMSDDKQEALDIIAHKIARILNGDPNYADSWHDIIGYARLVEQTLEGGRE